MTLSVRLLNGLPAYGDRAIGYPASFGKTGREGTVVQFNTDDRQWVGNFRPGFDGLNLAVLHPNARDAIVIARGDLWSVNLETQSAEYLCPEVQDALEVSDPDGWLFSRQGLAWIRLGADGMIWHTKRLSWDGFDQQTLSNGKLTGLAWNPMTDSWEPYEVNLRTGESTGGSFSEEDHEGWERLADVSD